MTKTLKNIHENTTPLLGVTNADQSGEGVFLNSHPYHTKMPPSIITKHIEHYTKPGDTVLDPFCGSGMTGIAALLTKRDIILNDLSPAAIHISKGNNKKVDCKKFVNSVSEILNEAEEKINALYKTDCSCGKSATIAYSIWSDVYSCPNCKNEIVLWNVAVDSESGKISKTFSCTNCLTQFDKSKVSNHKTSSVPVVTVYDCDDGCKPKRKEHRTTEAEKKDLQDVENMIQPLAFPIVEMMNLKAGEKWGEQWRSGYHSDVTHVHHFFTKRNFLALNYLYKIISTTEDNDLREKLVFAFTGSLVALTRMVKYIPSRGGRSNVPGTLYIPSLNLEQNVFLVFKRRAERIIKLVEWQKGNESNVQFNLGSANNLNWIEENSVDYIFTDPPFGANIQYAELNFITESWLGIYTEIDKEMVINKTREQNIERYNSLFTESLREMYRVLKPNGFTSLVFHNTNSEVWGGLRQAIIDSGFIIEGVSMLDKGKGGWNQVTSSSGTARFDIIIQLRKTNINHQYIPSSELTENEVIDYLIKHLDSVPFQSVRERTLPFLHSKIIQLILTSLSRSNPPNMKQLEKLLNENFVNVEGFYYSSIDI